MQIIPVLDLKGGCVVHAVRGRRERYHPIESSLVESSRPGEVAAAFLAMGFEQIYVADLDAIETGQPNDESIRAIAATGMDLWLDTGRATFRRLQPSRCDPVFGLESLASLAELDQRLHTAGCESFIFSLDHHDGVPITRIADWQNMTIATIALESARRGVRRFIDLDLARVGSGQGPQSRGLVAELRREFSDLFVAVGGGVRNLYDVQTCSNLGYDAVLIATALHHGTITAAEVRGLKNYS